MGTAISSVSSFVGGPTFQSGLSLLNTGISAYSANSAGRVRAMMLASQAEQEKIQAYQQGIQANQQRLQARQYELQGENQANVLKNQLINNLSNVNAVFAGRGVDVASRSVQYLKDTNIANTRRDENALRLATNINTQNAEMQALSTEMNMESGIAQSSSTRAMAPAARAMGRAQMFSQLFGETSRRSVSSLLSGFSGLGD